MTASRGSTPGLTALPHLAPREEECVSWLRFQQPQSASCRYKRRNIPARLLPAPRPQARIPHVALDRRLQRRPDDRIARMVHQLIIHLLLQVHTAARHVVGGERRLDDDAGPAQLLVGAEFPALESIV